MLILRYHQSFNIALIMMCSCQSIVRIAEVDCISTVHIGRKVHICTRDFSFTTTSLNRTSFLSNNSG